MVVFYFFRNMVRNMTKLRIDCNPQWGTRYEVSLRLFTALFR